ncbi:hypothetical protein MCEMAEM6B_02213 [Mycobacteriaceae bacterium]
MPSKGTGLVFAATMFAALAGATLVGAPIAAADPNDWVPFCTAGQIPEPGECLPAPNSVYIDDAPGANPEIPLGLNPESVPAI